MRKHTGVCSFPECDRRRYCGELCNPHWQQQRRGIQLFVVHSRKRPTGVMPVLKYVECPCPKPELIGPCWVFSGNKDRYGYGRIAINNKTVGSHVYAWTQKHGPITKGLVLDHKCRVRACCNPDHLRLVTRRANTLENSEGVAALHAAKTHCVNGHLFDTVNTRIRNGWRYCRKCQAIRARRKSRPC